MPDINQKTVCFLGAGASKADGAPTQGELFREYFTSQGIQQRIEQEMNLELQDYFWLFWGIDVTADNMRDFKFPTFEEAIGILEIAHSRGDFFKRYGGRDQHATRGQELRTHLTSVIALILEEKLRTPVSAHHRKLLEQLHREEYFSSTSFISLNYDLLIDNAIEESAIQAGQHALPDYSVKFTPEPHRDNIPFPRTSLLLKLHGSLNWLYCPTCNNLSLFPGHKIAAELPGGPWRFYCQECHEIRVPIIIPPTFFKVMSNFYLQQIWKRAEDELKQANRIIFCGYSFPDADMHIKYLLKRAEVNRIGDAPDVFIVNEPQGKKEQEREMEMDRYKRFFRRKDKVHWVNLSFEQFAANPTMIEDRNKWL